MTDTALLPIVTLKPRNAMPFFNRHPWVFKGAIGKVVGAPAPGAEVVVQSHEGKFIARGLFNPDSNIQVRLYCWEQSESLDAAFWTRRIEAAIRLRRDCVETPDSNAYRLIFSESDGLSGLTVDRYDEWLLVQLTSRALAERRELILDVLQERLSPRGIWLRTEKGIAEVEGLKLADGLLRGETPPRPLAIRENGLTFLVDVAEGQKTGAFLDQRDNRRVSARYCQGRRVLDLFSYSGGFGITAAKLGEAESVICVDSSQPALDAGRRNAEANGVSERIEFVRSDVFRYLEEAKARGEQFDVVVLDPPKMARQQAGIEQALRGYHSLNALAASLVKPGGILLTCSCSGRIGRQDFEMMLANVSTSLRRPLQVLEARGPASDHPVSPNCPENNYLKCYVCCVG